MGLLKIKAIHFVSQKAKQRGGQHYLLKRLRGLFFPSGSALLFLTNSTTRKLLTDGKKNKKYTKKQINAFKRKKI